MPTTKELTYVTSTQLFDPMYYSKGQYPINQDAYGQICDIAQGNHPEYELAR